MVWFFHFRVRALILGFELKTTLNLVTSNAVVTRGIICGKIGGGGKPIKYFKCIICFGQGISRSLRTLQIWLHHNVEATGAPCPDTSFSRLSHGLRHVIKYHRAGQRCFGLLAIINRTLVRVKVKVQQLTRKS